jgi:hypothetical protein
MRRGAKTFVCVLGAITVVLGAKAITGDPTALPHGEAPMAGVSAKKAASNGTSPYDAIVERNVFDLKDPPDTNTPPPPPNDPPPNVRLTGIMSIFGHEQALFMVQKSGQPGKGAEPEVSYILTEGQRQEGLEVLKIDSKDKKVKIKNDGIVSTISFEVAKAGGLGGPHHDMTPGQPHMGKPGFAPTLNPNAGAMPQRTLRTPQLGQASPQAGGGNPGGGYNANPYGYGNAGYNAGGVSGVGYNQNPGQPQSNVSAEEQVAMALAQQQQHQDAIAAGRYPSLPQIPGLTGPQSGPGQETTGQQSAQNPSSTLPAFLQPHTTGNFPATPH